MKFLFIFSKMPAGYWLLKVRKLGSEIWPDLVDLLFNLVFSDDFSSWVLTYFWVFIPFVIFIFILSRVPFLFDFSFYSPLVFCFVILSYAPICYSRFVEFSSLASLLRPYVLAGFITGVYINAMEVISSFIRPLIMGFRPMLNLGVVKGCFDSWFDAKVLSWFDLKITLCSDSRGVEGVLELSYQVLAWDLSWYVGVFVLVIVFFLYECFVTCCQSAIMCYLAKFDGGLYI